MAGSSSQSTLLTGSTHQALRFPSAFNYSLPLKLDRNNYLTWRSQVIPAVQGHGLEGFVLGASKRAPQYIEVADKPPLREL